MISNISKPTPTVIAAVSAASTATALVLWWRRHQQRKNRLYLQAKVECVCGKVCLKLHSINKHDVLHMVCYCDHCQHYAQCLQAHHLKRSVVDAQGGTRTCQLYRSNVQIEKGAELLQFSYFNPNKVPLRPQQMFRAHAACCKTPMVSAFWKELPVMGVYAANMTEWQTEDVKGKDDNDKFIQLNPTTQLWEDDNTDGTARLHRINCQCALVQASSEASSPQAPLQQQPSQKQQAQLAVIQRGYTGFPLKLLVRFLWRNYVAGPRIAATDFYMPPEHKPIVIPSEMKSVPAFPLYDLIFG